MFGRTLTGMLLMTADPPPLPPLAAAVVQRLADVNRLDNLNTIAEASGVSDNTWRPLLKTGRMPKRPGKRVAVARYLNWVPNALDLLESGVDPADIPERTYPKADAKGGTSEAAAPDAERVAGSLSEVMSFLTPDEQAQLAAIAKTFLSRRRANEDQDQP